jgi:hypothetical protein
VHGRPQPLAARRAIEQDLDHIGPTHAGNDLTSRGHDASPYAVDCDLVEQPFGVGLCQRSLAFCANCTTQVRARQVYLIISLNVAGIEAEIARTAESKAREAGNSRSRRHVTSETSKEMLIYLGSQPLSGYVCWLVEANSPAMRRSTLPSPIAPGGVLAR